MSLDDFLAEVAKRNKQCATCALGLDDDLREFFRRKRDGETCVSFGRYHSFYMRDQQNYPYGITAASNHVTRCLRLDVKTGASLDG